MTGLSGSGKTVALRAIEDSGFFSADNLPPQLMDQFIRLATERKDVKSVGIGIDIREKEFIPEFESAVESLRDKYNLLIIFLEADRDALIRRYKETRRPHPLAGPSIEASIESEAQILEPLRAHADRVIDTTNMSPHQLREHIISLLGLEGSVFHLTVMSFGYKYSVPQTADLLFDARFLPNPFFVPELKDLCGRDEPVRDFVIGNEVSREFVRRISELLNFLIPLYRKEGKSSLTIGIGCTGGKHRSPVIAELVALNLKGLGLPISVVHRDM